MITARDIELLYNEQLPAWQLARDNYAALDKMLVRQVDVEGCNVAIQFNPCRTSSVTTNINKCHEKPCFLCNDNLPQEQLRLSLWNEYRVLVNPYPLFKHHFTIAATAHTPQRIAGRMGHMLQMAACFAPYTIFYNGPYSGASAPMHMHFQAAEGGFMPIERQWKEATRKEIAQCGEGCMFLLSGLLRPIVAIEGKNITDIESLFDTLYQSLGQLPVNQSCDEPMMNILARYEEGRYIVWVFPRAKHRPDCYYATGCERLLVSPGSVEMGGVFITVREEDYNAMSPETIHNIYSQVTPSQEELCKVFK